MPYAADALMRPIERVLCGQGYGGDVAVCGRAFALPACVDVVVVSIGIGADAGNLVFLFEVPMGHASGYDEHVAFVDAYLPACLTAQHEGRGPFYESKHFVGDGVIVVIGEDAVVPGVAPAMLFKEVLYVAGL